MMRVLGGEGKRCGSVTGVTGCGCNIDCHLVYPSRILSVSYMPEADVANPRSDNKLRAVKYVVCRVRGK